MHSFIVIIVVLIALVACTEASRFAQVPRGLKNSKTEKSSKESKEKKSSKESKENKSTPSGMSSGGTTSTIVGRSAVPPSSNSTSTPTTGDESPATNTECLNTAPKNACVCSSTPTCWNRIENSNKHETKCSQCPCTSPTEKNDCSKTWCVVHPSCDKTIDTGMNEITYFTENNFLMKRTKVVIGVTKTRKIEGTEKWDYPYNQKSYYAWRNAYSKEYGNCKDSRVAF